MHEHTHANTSTTTYTHFIFTHHYSFTHTHIHSHRHPYVYITPHPDFQDHCIIVAEHVESGYFASIQFPVLSPRGQAQGAWPVLSVLVGPAVPAPAAAPGLAILCTVEGRLKPRECLACCFRRAEQGFYASCLAHATRHRQPPLPAVRSPS